ncbi:MAG TPA: pitrilysin family protein [Candidatus Eisenbacteria bacterium]|nr:pitrilysin family protein [Candidatus Eisenbacteria bacterium]
MRTQRSWTVWLAGLVVFSLLAAGAASAADKTATWPQLKYEKYKLKNGLEVILSEDHRLPLVAVNLWYHVGPMYEKPGRTGFAHLFEHMMFQGSKNVGEKAHIKYLEAAGASDINGTTDFDRTNYYETLPSNQLELALWLESDRMGFLLETLDGPKLANQRDVVRNERRQSTENTPYGLPEEAMVQALYPAPHPYHGVVIGSHADIEAAKLDDVREFFRQYYTPNNASIAIVGDFDPAKAKQMVEKYFEPIPSGPPVPPVDVKTQPIRHEVRLTVTDEVELPRVYMLWITPPYFAAGDADADMVAHVLGGGKSSRLYKKLVYELQIAQDVDTQRYPLKLGSMFYIQATCKPAVTPAELETAINQELTGLRKNGPTGPEVEQARNSIQSALVFRLERMGGVANLLNQYNLFLGDPGKLDWDLARYDAVTAESMKKFADTSLGDQSRVVLYAVKGKKVIDDPPQNKEPEKASSVASLNIPGQEWRKTAPAPGPVSKLSLPVPKQLTLSNGLTVLLTEQHNLPIVAARVVVLGGNGDNPANNPGLAGFTARMLTEGTKSRSALKIADDLAQIGAKIESDSDPDNSAVSSEVLKRNVRSDLDVVSDVVLHPAFDGKDIERVRSERATLLLQTSDDPFALSRRVSQRLLYGDHDYGYLPLGTEASIKNTTRDELEEFWKKDYVPANTALVLAGDLTEAEARSLAENYFGAWKNTGKRSPVPQVTANPSRSIYLVDRPGSAQTTLRAVTLGAPRSTPEYAALEVANNALGGLFASRINMNLRERNGYTYGASSYFNYRRGSGPFYVVTSVRTDSTVDALREMMKEIEGMQTVPLTPGEMSLSKDAAARSLAGNFETMPRTVDTTSELFTFELPLDFYDELPAQVEAVTTQDVERVARQYFVHSKMFVVVVGDRQKIESGLQGLDMGKVQLISFDGTPAAAPAAGTAQ